MSLEEHQFHLALSDMARETPKGDGAIGRIDDHFGHPNQRAPNIIQSLSEVHLDETCPANDAEPHGTFLYGLACQFCGDFHHQIFNSI